MTEFWINGIGGIIITILAFIVGLSFKKDHPIMARLFVIFAFCWVFFPLLSAEPTYIHNGCLVTVGPNDDNLAWLKSLLVICIPLISIFSSAKNNKIFFDDNPKTKVSTDDDFDDGL